MFRNLFKRFFPTPSFLMASSFGLDISDESLKYAELVVVRDGIRMGRHGERSIPTGVIKSGKIKDQKRLSEILISLKKELRLKSVRVSLPEEQVYLFQLHLEKFGLKNVRESIELSLEEHIPIPAQDAIFDYDKLKEDDKSLDLQVAAISTDVIKSYLSVFKDSGIPVRSSELEAQAIARAVIKKGDLDTYMIVDFGQTRTGIFIISRGVAVSTSTFDIGGAMIVDMIEQSLHINSKDAERLKIENGLLRNASNREIFAVILNAVAVLRDEMAKHFLYWHTHRDENGKDRPPIKKIILCGGASNLAGLSEYISISLKVPVELANVWVNIMDITKHAPDISFKDSLSLAAVFGLALGDFDHD